jgi:hypothetical protein
MTCKMLALMSLSFLACGDPAPGIVVTREAGHYMITIINCGDPKWDDPLIYRVAVGKSPPGGRLAEQCSLRVSAEGSHGHSLKQWRYDSQPEGTILEHCAPLEPGATYEVFVDASPKFAIGHFRIERDDDVTMLDGPCRK